VSLSRRKFVVSAGAVAVSAAVPSLGVIEDVSAAELNSAVDRIIIADCEQAIAKTLAAVVSYGFGAIVINPKAEVLVRHVPVLEILG